MNLTQAFRRARGEGVAYIPRWLPHDTLRELRDYYSGNSWRWKQCPIRIGEVTQEVERLAPHQAAYHNLSPEIWGIREHLTAAAKEAGFQWCPLDVDIQRYPAGSTGITGHRDSKQYTGFIAVITITGQAHFRYHYTGQRDTEHYMQYHCQPGDLTLMSQNVPPMHSITGPLTDEPRTVLIFREDTKQ